MFAHLGIPVAQEKVEGPSTTITMAMQLRLLANKLAELRNLVKQWMQRKSRLKKDLQSLAGKLQHASKVVRPGRTFLRRVFELLKVTVKKYHHIRLNNEFRSDLMWWDTYLSDWNGVSMVQGSARTQRVAVFTDASGEVGCGGWWGTRWFQFKWPPVGSFRDLPITQKEVLPVVMATAVWGSQWYRSAVKIFCDNEGAVAVLTSGYSRDPQIMRLLRFFFFIFKWTYPFHTYRARIIHKQMQFPVTNCHCFLTGPRGQAIAHTNEFYIGGSASGTATRLDFASLGSTVQELFSAGLANSTLKSYKSGSTRYCNFCAAYKVPAFPATEKVVCSFVAKLYLEGVAGNSMKTYLAAIWYLQIALGLGDPQMAHWSRLHFVVRGCKKRTASKRRNRLPITPELLRQLKATWVAHQDINNAKRLWAAAYMCFFGFLRVGEAVVPLVASYDPEVHLNEADVSVDSRDGQYSNLYLQ